MGNQEHGTTARSLPETGKGTQHVHSIYKDIGVYIDPYTPE